MDLEKLVLCGILEAALQINFKAILYKLKDECIICN